MDQQVKYGALKERCTGHKEVVMRNRAPQGKLWWTQRAMYWSKAKSKVCEPRDVWKVWKWVENTMDPCKQRENVMKSRKPSNTARQVKWRNGANNESNSYSN